MSASARSISASATVTVGLWSSARATATPRVTFSGAAAGGWGAAVWAAPAAVASEMATWASPREVPAAARGARARRPNPGSSNIIRPSIADRTGRRTATPEAGRSAVDMRRDRPRPGRAPDCRPGRLAALRLDPGSGRPPAKSGAPPGRAPFEDALAARLDRRGLPERRARGAAGGHLPADAGLPVVRSRGGGRSFRGRDELHPWRAHGPAGRPARRARRRPSRRLAGQDQRASPGRGAGQR